MAEFSFIPDAGTKIKELEPSGSHTAAQSMQKGETNAPIQNLPAAARLAGMLEDFGFSVSSLKLEVEKECVRISGKVKDQETREKVILVVGNVQGISKVEENLKVVTSSPEARLYTVEKTDSLEIIAEKLFRNPTKARELLAANAPMLKSGKELYPGRVLRIPLEE